MDNITRPSIWLLLRLSSTSTALRAARAGGGATRKAVAEGLGRLKTRLPLTSSNSGRSLTTPEEVTKAHLSRGERRARTVRASILWMHTFSPARKCGFGGLICSSSKAASATCTRSSTATCRGTRIDMDFMNLNQVRARRPRGGSSYTRASVCERKVDRRALVRPRGCWSASRRVGAGGLHAWARLAGREDRALRRQHALRRRDRGR